MQHVELMDEHLPSGKKLILLDGHSSYISKEFADFCEERNWTVIYFPSHMSHKLQPCDLVPNAVIKQRFKIDYNAYESIILEEQVTLGKFVVSLLKSANSSLTASHIQNAFKRAGIYPFNNKQIPLFSETYQQYFEEAVSMLQLVDSSVTISTLSESESEALSTQLVASANSQASNTPVETDVVESQNSNSPTQKLSKSFNQYSQPLMVASKRKKFLDSQKEKLLKEYSADIIQNPSSTEAILRLKRKINLKGKVLEI